MSELKIKKGLGKGLSALLGDDQQAKPDLPKTTVAIADISRNPFQPRINFDQEKITELANSIKNNGIIQPIVVRPGKQDKYELVAGERRWLAAQQAGLHEIPVNIVDLSDKESLELAILENIQRENLNVIEEARGYQRLMNEFGYSHEDVSQMMSKSRSHVSNTLRLLNLPADVIKMLEAGQLSAGQVRPLIGMPNASSIAEEIVSKRMSARSVEILAKEKKKPLKLVYAMDSNLENIKLDLQNKVGLKIDINNKKNNSGKLTIHYKDLDQFEMIIKKLKS